MVLWNHDLWPRQISYSPSVGTLAYGVSSITHLFQVMNFISYQRFISPILELVVGWAIKEPLPSHYAVGVGICLSLLGLSWQRLGGLNSRNLFSQFSRLKVQDQSVDNVCLFWGLALWRVDGHLLPMPLPVPSVHVCVYTSCSH